MTPKNQKHPNHRAGIYSLSKPIFYQRYLQVNGFPAPNSAITGVLCWVFYGHRFYLRSLSVFVGQSPTPTDTASSFIAINTIQTSSKIIGFLIPQWSISMACELLAVLFITNSCHVCICWRFQLKETAGWYWINTCCFVSGGKEAIWNMEIWGM